jgi:hypothetical protein
MKNIVIVIASALLLFALGACNKTDKSKASTSSFIIDGKEWKSDKMRFSWSSDKKFTVSYAKGLHSGANFDGTDGFDEKVSLNFIEKKMGKQEIRALRISDIGSVSEENSFPSAFINTTSQEGCVGCEDFMVDSTNAADNWIEITKQEKNYRKIWGKFSLTMIKESSGCDQPRYSDTIRIQNAEFYLEL